MTRHGPSPTQRLCASREQIRHALDVATAARRDDIGPWPATAAALASAAWAVSGHSAKRWPRWVLATGMVVGVGAIAWIRSQPGSPRLPEGRARWRSGWRPWQRWQRTG